EQFGPVQRQRGFTLVELMLVVAIAGVLAALATYGVRKYINTAKRSEAHQALGKIAKDAITAFAREGMDGQVLPQAESAEVSHQLCGSAPNTVPGDKAKIQGRKYQSNEDDWAAGDARTGWQCLKFTMRDPQYFMYGYSVSGEGTQAGDGFVASAQGDLNGDGSLSLFELRGDIQSGSG